MWTFSIHKRTFVISLLMGNCPRDLRFVKFMLCPYSDKNKLNLNHLRVVHSPNVNEARSKVINVKECNSKQLQIFISF